MAGGRVRPAFRAANGARIGSSSSIVPSALRGILSSGTTRRNDVPGRNVEIGALQRSERMQRQLAGSGPRANRNGDGVLMQLQGDLNTYLDTYYSPSNGEGGTMQLDVEDLRLARVRMQRLEPTILLSRLHGLRLIMAMSQQALRSRAANLETGISEMDPRTPSGVQSLPFVSSLIAMQARQPNIPTGVPPTQLNELMPKMSYALAGQHVPAKRQITQDDECNAECCICLTELLPSDSVRLLPCKHIYHAHCVDRWFMRSTRCPTCKEHVCPFSESHYCEDGLA